MNPQDGYRICFLGEECNEMNIDRVPVHIDGYGPVRERVYTVFGLSPTAYQH